MVTQSRKPRSVKHCHVAQTAPLTDIPFQLMFPSICHVEHDQTIPPISTHHYASPLPRPSPFVLENIPSPQRPMKSTAVMRKKNSLHPTAPGRRSPVNLLTSFETSLALQNFGRSLVFGESGKRGFPIFCDDSIGVESRLLLRSYVSALVASLTVPTCEHRDCKTIHPRIFMIGNEKFALLVHLIS